MMESVYSAQLQIAVGRDDATTSGNCTPADLTGDMSEVPVLISDEVDVYFSLSLSLSLCVCVCVCVCVCGWVGVRCYATLCLYDCAT